MDSDQHTIESLLASHNASFKGVSGDAELARQRAHLTNSIGNNYPAFEPIRNCLLDRPGKIRREDLCDDGNLIAEKMFAMNMIVEDNDRHKPATNRDIRYISGGWLEELAWLAAMEAGADEAVFSQSLSWKVKGRHGEYHGENEVDLILRKGNRLGFTSCKAVGSVFESHNRKHRNRLMDALHEADNLADHFGGENDRVAVLVTADLIDEVRDQPRYMALMGKAAVLDVRIIPLEELGWDKLVAAIGELVDGA